MVVGLGTLGFLMSTPGQTMGVSPFTDYLIDALGLTRVQLSAAYMFGTMASSLLLTRAGRLYDRFGARAMGPAASLGLGLVLLILSRADSIALFLGRVVPGIAAGASAMVVMILAFFLLRFTGQGVLTLVSTNMIMKWFDRRRGFAMGIGGVFSSLGFSAAPLLLDLLIRRFGWRGAWVVLAAAIGGGFSVLALLFYRDNPEDCGLEADGTPRSDREHDLRRAPKQFTLEEARRCYTFWAFCLTIAVFGLYFTAMTFHIVSLFGVAGMSRVQALGIFLPAAAISVAIRLAGGWLSDRIDLKYLLIVMLVGMGISMSGMMVLAPGFAVWLVIVGNGVSGGLFGLLSTVTWPKYFGRLHLGAISGFSYSVTVFSSAVGPWVFGQSLAVADSYRPACIGCLVMTALLLGCALRVHNPQNAAEGE